MAEEVDIPQQEVQQQVDSPEAPQPPDKVEQYYNYLKKAGADVAPTLDSFKKTLSNDSTAKQYYGYLRDNHFDAPPSYGSFAKTLGISSTPVVAEHQVSHTDIHDIRHLNELANQPVRSSTTTLDPMSGGSMTEYNQEDIARNKAYQGQYEKRVTDWATASGLDPKAAKSAIEGFPDEMDEGKLKGFATLAKDNPVYYSRLKSANDIRVAIAKSGPSGINDANEFNHLQSADNYDQLQENIAAQQEIMTKHGLSQAYFEKLKESQAPLINTLDPGLHIQYWNSDDKKLGLSEFQYAGLETEKMFNPGKYRQDVAILRQNRGLDNPGAGGPVPVPQGKEGYAYDRGVENVLYALENQGRQNTSKFIDQRSAEIGKPIEELKQKYQDWIKSTDDPMLQKHFFDEFHNDPLLQEAGRLDEGQQSIEYARTEDQRRFPLNYGDQASRLVKDAMSTTTGWAGVGGKQILLGAGESADNTMRFIKNTYINLLGSEQAKASNAASNIGHQALTELSGYEGSTYASQESPLTIGESLVKKIQATFDDPALSEIQKNQKAVGLIQENENEIKVNPKAGQQNLTGKAMLYSATNTIGQILGIADQSMLMGGLLGDASKAQQMANSLVPMYASTQNQLYEQALARGEEKPLLKSSIDAAIVSLASLINPDMKVVKGMIGTETGIGKLIAGVDESTWNKVLSDNKTIVDRMVAGTKATARQLGLANLQYGLIVPTAQYVVHKNVFNEDPNLADSIKDGIVQTNITMALPALLHGVWGGIDVARVNPAQKFAIVEAGLHPKENIELLDQMVEKGQITPDKADQIRNVIKQTGEILEHTEAIKTDQKTWMNEHEVADLTYQMLRKKVLEGKLKNAPDPQKPAIEKAIHSLDQSIAKLHTSEADKQKNELNTLLTDNMDRISEKMPVMEGQIKEAIKRNEPEQVFKEIYDQATETRNVDGKEVSSRPLAEEIFGDKMVQKAFDLHNQKPEKNAEHLAIASDPAGNEGQVTEKPSEGAAAETNEPVPPAASSFLQSRHADTIHDEQGIVSGPNNKELSAKGKRDANDLAKDVEGKGITTIITSGLERSKETGDKVAEKIGAKAENRPALDTWNIKDFDGLKDEDFKGVQEWYVENPESTVYQGPLEKYRGKEVGESVNEYAGRIIPEMEKIEKEAGPDTLVINHSNNMMLWDAYLKNGREWNDQARQDYLNAEKPEPATLANQESTNYNKNSSNAIPERSPAGEVPRTGTAGENIPAGSEGMGSGQQGEAAASQAGGKGEGQEQEPSVGAGGEGPTDPDEWPFREEPTDIPNGIKKAISTSIRARLELPEIALPKLGSEAQVLQRGKTAVDSGVINPREVAARVVENNGIYTPDEGAAMLYYGHQLRQAETDARAERTEAADLLKKDPGNTAAFYAQLTSDQRLGQLDDAIDLKTKADRLNSRAWGNLGNVMQIETDESFSPSRIKATVEENYGGNLPKDVEEKLERAFAERDAAISDMKKAKDKVALMQLEKDAAKDQPAKEPKTVKEKKEALKKERIDLIEELKKAIKKDSGNLGANPLPLHTIEAISKLALNYFKDGIVTLEGLTNKIYDDLKDVVDNLDKKSVRDAISGYQPLREATRVSETAKANRKAELAEEKLESGKIEPTRRTPVLRFLKDADYIKADQRRINAEFLIKQEKMKSYASKESRLQKTLGWANRLMRLSILSGVKVLEKLAAAATIGSAAQKPFEEILNGLWGQAFPKIREKSDADMGMNLLAVGRYYSHFFNPVEFARDTKDIVRHGETPLGKELEKQHFDHIPLLDLPTDLHQVIKGPAKRATFEYALTKILADQQSKGIDINHPLVMESARQRAFARAKYEIFMEDNQISRQFGKWESQWRDQGKAGAAKSFLLHFAFPVSKVPTNIARRVGLSVTGLPQGLYKAAEAYRNGIENLSTDEANAIGRALTKGSIGIALWTAGFLGYKSLGGLYSKFDPNKQRKNEPLADEMKLIGQPISKPWQHALPFEVMQLGATFRHIYEKTKTTTKSDPIAIAEATMGSAGAILEQIPVVETPINAITATQDPYQAKKLGDDLKRRVEPQLLQDLGVIKKEDKKTGPRKPNTAGGHSK